MILIRIIFCIIFVPLSWILGGYTTAKLWHWFVVPTFHLTDLSIVVAMGINQLINFLTFSLDTTKEEYKEKYQIETYTFVSISISLLALAFGYVLTLFM